MIEPPGYPIASPFRRLSDDEQEQARREHRELQARIAPAIEESERCRRRAAALAHSAVIG